MAHADGEKVSHRMTIVMEKRRVRQGLTNKRPRQVADEPRFSSPLYGFA
jgi:hypothetical protein